MGLWSLLSSICLAVMVVMLVIYYGVWRSNSGRAEFFFCLHHFSVKAVESFRYVLSTSVKSKTSQVYSQIGEYYSGGEISFLEQDRGFDPTCCIFFSWARLVLRVSCWLGWWSGISMAIAKSSCLAGCKFDSCHHPIFYFYYYIKFCFIVHKYMPKGTMTFSMTIMLKRHVLWAQLWRIQ